MKKNWVWVSLVILASQAVLSPSGWLAYHAVDAVAYEISAALRCLIKWSGEERPLCLSICNAETKAHIYWAPTTWSPLCIGKISTSLCSVQVEPASFPNSELAPKIEMNLLSKSQYHFSHDFHNVRIFFCGQNGAGYLKFFLFLMVCIPNSSQLFHLLFNQERKQEKLLSDLYQSNTM